MATELENTGTKVTKWATRRAIRSLFLNGHCRYRGRQYTVQQAAQFADYATLQSVHVALGTKSMAADLLGLPQATDVLPRRVRPQLVCDDVHQIRVRTYNCESLRVLGRIDDLLRRARAGDTRIAAAGHIHGYRCRMDFS